MEWDKAFVEELASRRCIIFLGSGASAGSLSADEKKRPPNWVKLLKLLLDSVPVGDDKSYAETLIEQKQFLEAAEVICSHISGADFATHMRAEFVTPKYKPSDIHKSVLKIDPKIVITTNYDDIYDKYCSTGDASDGYNVCRYDQTHLINDLRSPVRSIVKAHGCMTDPSKIVLTKSQFFKARQDHSNFFKLLDALFLTHTLFFIGYSLSDPDIQLLLENTHITAPSAHKHYAAMHKDEMNSAIKNASMKSYNLKFVEYGGNDHSELISGLSELANLVVEKREINPSSGG
jgi:hypothetical protein